MSDDTWHGAESPPAGAEIDERYPPVDRAAAPDHARADCPYPAGCSGCLQDIRPSAPDEIPHAAVPADDGIHCERCGGYLTDRCHTMGGASADYRSKADEFTIAVPQDRVRSVDDVRRLDQATRAELDAIGAGEAPPAQRLASFRCGTCNYTFTADEDTRVCPRCQTGDRLIETFYGTSPEAVEKAAEALTDGPVVEAGPTMDELRQAGVLVALGPIRSRLDIIWQEIASSMVSTVADARAVVQAWMTSEYAAGSGELHLAMSQLRRRLGMAPGAGGNIPDPGGPHVNLLWDTVDMMRSEADQLDKVEGSLRAAGAARRLREQADYIQGIVGSAPT